MRGQGVETYLICGRCDSRYLDPQRYLTSEEEKAHYLTHNNDVTDPRYQAFVRPLYSEIQARRGSGTRGLDYGAGTGPVLAEMLEADSCEITRYDPFFWPESIESGSAFDFVFSCEVVEHFHSPAEEFSRIRKLIRSGGFFILMTHLYEPGCDFRNWYYRRDPTHVIFYSRKSFDWIAGNLGFSTLEVVSDRIVVLSVN